MIDDFFETLAEALRPPTSWKHQLPVGVKSYAKDKYKEEMDCLYYPTLIVLPLTPQGELERERLHREDMVSRYGCYEHNFDYKGVTYLAIIINND